MDREFEVWWLEVPKKVGKEPARKKYLVARRSTDAPTLLAGIRRYAELRAGQDMQFTLYPATWLHQKRWLDGDAADNPATMWRDPGPQGPPPTKLADLWSGNGETVFTAH